MNAPPSLARHKLAADEEEDAPRLGRDALVGGLVAAPFAGMLGQKAIQHDPYTNPAVRRFRSAIEMSRHARPGDLLLSTDPTDAHALPLRALSGSDFYHAQPIVGRRGGQATTLMAGGEAPVPGGKRKTLREAQTVQRSLHGTGENAVLLRPKKPLSPEELEAFVATAAKQTRTPFHGGQAIRAWLRDLFVPKLKGLGSKDAPDCPGGVCSTQTAKAYAAGKRSVVPGKGAPNVLAPDFLRSDAFEPQGVLLRTKPLLSPRARKLFPYLFRGGLGLGMGGLAYGVSEDPAVAALPVGAVAGHLGARALVRTPSFLRMLEALQNTGTERNRAALRGYAKSGLPGMALGAAGAYGGAKLLQHLLRREDR